MEVKLRWMNSAAPASGGVTFGLPWKKGELSRETKLYLKDANGKAVNLQSRPRAFWPDGSVKWTLHSAVLSEKQNAYFLGDTPLPPEEGPGACAVSVEEKDGEIIVKTGVIVCTIGKESKEFIRAITGNSGKPLCTGGRLVAINRQRHSKNGYSAVYTDEEFWGKAYYAWVEETGPERAVIRLRGSHTGEVTGMRTTSQFRKWLTFDLRLYFYAGSDEIRMVHTFYFDGREEEDFIRGIGMEFDIPMVSALFNRYVRFGGESGLFAESPKSLWVRQKRDYDKFYEDQLDGKEVLFDAQTMLNDMTAWNDFKMTQLSSEEYVISKRTQNTCVYVRGANGRRSMGLAYAGGPNNGIALVKKDFWQKAPASFEACGMLENTATLKAWFWSPDAQPMDLRRYDNKTHVEACYEGFEEMRSTAYGIGNTNELSVKCCGAFPGNEALIDLARERQAPNLMLAPVQRYIETNVFGRTFSEEDRSTPGRAKVESMLDAQLEFYLNEREQSKWYGFWDYGDIRHAYDEIRHSWRYDMGGFAWQNTELVPNLWLWFGFLRSQREDYFRLAEAMTRHTSEVDLYHLGEYKMLGSRHNVVHWGCGCKEVRVGLCLMHKIYYYLTGDERVGDIMDDERDADFSLARLDPLRAYFTPDPRYSAHIRWGPDIIALCEIWLTRWERYEDTVYRDKILKMLDHFRKPGDFAASSIWGYDPKTGDMACLERKGGVHFNHCFGTVYSLSEVLTVLEDEQLWENFYDMGQIYSRNLPGKEALLEKWGLPKSESGIDAGSFARMAIYFTGTSAVAARQRDDADLAQEVWAVLLHSSGEGKYSKFRVPIKARELKSPRVHKTIQEAEYVTGNAASQWGSNAIVALAAIGDKIPED
ncbi:MAG: hypothetical protein LBH26_08090 [Treponema sp.]|jgi:hypothetical protein|nr:hypothetical protein [Treponema sp.]